MTRQPETDTHVREEALDATKSFLIQAPAGSGKTELLIQRFLVLLSTSANAPEEIIAITFTRKAAAEMRERVMAALAMALKIDRPEALEPHKQTTWRLAKAVLKQDAALSWGLIYNPNRLRIQTIDSLSASLSRQSPLLSRFGCQPKVTTNPKPLYEQAAGALLNASRGNSTWITSLERLQRHLNNQLGSIEALIANMLARRDQWMPYLMSMGSSQAARNRLEKSLQSLVDEHLMTLANIVPKSQHEPLLKLLRFAAHELDKAKISSPILAAKSIESMPMYATEDKLKWLAISELLFTTTNEWRKRVDKRQGFPAPSAANNAEEKQHYKKMKTAHLELIADLQETNVSPEVFRILKLLPPTEYADTDWQIIEALIELLPLAVAHLQVLFKTEGTVDFIEMSQRAELALGSDEAPTELALKLDYQILHLLVDEFQDTSIHQYRLLGRLVAEWEPYGNRTLFLVGDPMQSIYRFRQAEVSLFIRLKHQCAFEHLPLTFLRLFMNYRSESALVHWVNKSFQQVLPSRDDPEFGAVCHEVAIPVKSNSDSAGAYFHLTYDHQSQSQTAQILHLITNHRKMYPQDSIAVLVRSRTHLQDLLSQCREANLPYVAQDIDLLIEQPLVQDLLAMTRALTHLSDSVAWFSLLRAPFIGLSLDDLEVIANATDGGTIWDSLYRLLLSGFNTFCLSEAGKMRLERCVPALKKAIDNHRRLTLRDRVERLWLILSGPATLASKQALDFAKAYFDLLAEYEEGSCLVDMSRFEDRLLHLYAPSLSKDSSDNPIHVMTMHKSKGLEFDLVILPKLEKGGGRDEQKLLQWSERSNLDGQGGLLLGPIKASGAEINPIYQYIQEEEKKRITYERGRLLYVAATRAKKALHLFASVSVDEEQHLKKPKSDALLTLLLPQFEAYHHKLSFEEPVIDADANHSRLLKMPSQIISTLPSFWQPEYPKPIQEALKIPRQFVNNPKIHFADEIDIALHQEKPRLEGIFIHRILQAIVEDGLGDWQKRLEHAVPLGWRAGLARAGIPAEHLDESLLVIFQQLKSALDDPRGLWILNNSHRESVTEFEVSYREKGQVKTAILDRMFVDKGVRWIIDYKTPMLPEGLTKEAFLLQNQQQYAPQLNKYAKVISILYPNEAICCGLYLPAVQGWIHWEPELFQRKTADYERRL